MAEQKQSTPRALPKNIRQIGTSTGSTRIYLEDYVYTYLHTQETQEDWSRRGFMLIGSIEKNKDYIRYFISGMIRIRDEFFKDGILEFNDDTWAYIYQEMKKYYDNLDIVGWGQDVSGASAGMTAEIERSHKQNFNIQKNVLFLMDLVEKEEAFYLFEKNMLQRREGYYVYYEKNPQMQEYMIEMSGNMQLDVPADDIKEPLVHNYRETLQEKKAQLAARKWNGVLYTTSMLLVLSVCVLGVSTVNNVEKMQNLETTVSRISSQAGQAGVRSASSGASPAMSQNAQQEDSGEDAQEEGTGSPDKDSSDKGSLDKDNSDKDGSSKSGTEENIDKNTAGSSKSGREESINENINGNGTGSTKSGRNGNRTGSPESGKDEDAEGSIETAALNEAQTCLLQGYYIVKKGDSLVSISNKIYGTSKKAQNICDLNGIEDMDKIYAGQRLELP